MLKNKTFLALIPSDVVFIMLINVKMTTMQNIILLDFSLTVKAAPHECVIRTSQP